MYDEACDFIKNTLDEELIPALSRKIFDEVVKEIKEAAANNSFKVKKNRKFISGDLGDYNNPISSSTFHLSDNQYNDL